MRAIGLTVVLLAYNEAPRIGRLVDSMRSFAQEVVVVDDGSTDGTGRKAAKHRAKVIRHLRNLGYGAAMATGIRCARTEWVAVVDGDGQFPVEAVVRLWQAREGAEAVWGVRRHRADNLRRKMAGAVWRALCRVVLGLSLRDVDCGAKLFSRSVVQSWDIASTGAGVSAELAATLRSTGSKVKEVDVPHLPRRGGEATGLSWRVAWQGVRELLAVARRAGESGDVGRSGAAQQRRQGRAWQDLPLTSRTAHVREVCRARRHRSTN